MDTMRALREVIMFVDDDFVLRAAEVNRGALPNLGSGKGTSDEKSHRGSRRC